MGLALNMVSLSLSLSVCFSLCLSFSVCLCLSLFVIVFSLVRPQCCGEGHSKLEPPWPCHPTAPQSRAEDSGDDGSDPDDDPASGVVLRIRAQPGPTSPGELEEEGGAEVEPDVEGGSGETD